MLRTWPIWDRQVGHHGAQNHSSAGLPTRLAPSKGLPSTVVPVNRSESGIFVGAGVDGVRAATVVRDGDAEPAVGALAEPAPGADGAAVAGSPDAVGPTPQPSNGSDADSAVSKTTRRVVRYDTHPSSPG